MEPEHTALTSSCQDRNTTTFIIPGEVFPTRYRSTAHGISAASGKFGAIIAQIMAFKLRVLSSLPRLELSADRAFPRLLSLPPSPLGLLHYHHLSTSILARACPSQSSLPPNSPPTGRTAAARTTGSLTSSRSSPCSCSSASSSRSGRLRRRRASRSRSSPAKTRTTSSSPPTPLPPATLVFRLASFVLL